MNCDFDAVFTPGRVSLDMLFGLKPTIPMQKRLRNYGVIYIHLGNFATWAKPEKSCLLSRYQAEVDSPEDRLGKELSCSGAAMDDQFCRKLNLIDVFVLPAIRWVWHRILDRR